MQSIIVQDQPSFMQSPVADAYQGGSQRRDVSRRSTFFACSDERSGVDVPSKEERLFVSTARVLALAFAVKAPYVTVLSCKSRQWSE